ncbi:uncharacterized protein LOC122242634 [Penaeus japonicus]|uniref:uncharacterized protein LOC122242634 n=1 Tax=Penaeus japonicus TaxID=27405 RepID=UPI001C70B96E|nr:uncharacterized protein LOC122242634 [Penaeus japonicus]
MWKRHLPPCVNIPIRYGVKHGLTFALPPWIGEVPISPKILSPDYHGSPDGRYNMVVSHTQFNKEGAEQVMKESAKYVASLNKGIEQLDLSGAVSSGLYAIQVSPPKNKQQKNVMNKIVKLLGSKIPVIVQQKSECLSKSKNFAE